MSESRLELAGKQAFENFISIDGQAAAPKVVLEFGKPRRYPEKIASGSETDFLAKGLVLGSRRAPLKTGGSVHIFSACSQ